MVRWCGGCYATAVCPGFHNGPEPGMLQPGLWPSWWTNILGDAYRRGEASEGVDDRAGSKEERKIFLAGPYRSGDPGPHWHTLAVTRIKYAIIRYLTDLRSSSQRKAIAYDPRVDDRRSLCCLRTFPITLFFSSSVGLTGFGGGSDGANLRLNPRKPEITMTVTLWWVPRRIPEDGKLNPWLCIYSM